MDWIEGKTLDKYLRENMTKKENVNQNLLDELEGFKNQLLKLENDANKGGAKCWYVVPDAVKANETTKIKAYIDSVIEAKRGK